MNETHYFTIAYPNVSFTPLLHVNIWLIGKDGDDVINNVTCAHTGTESIKIHRVYTGNMALNRI